MTRDEVVKLIEDKLIEHDKMLAEMMQKRMAGQEAIAEKNQKAILAALEEITNQRLLDEELPPPVRMQ